MEIHGNIGNMIRKCSKYFRQFFFFDTLSGRVVDFKYFDVILQLFKAIGPGVVPGAQNNQLFKPLANMFLQTVIDIPCACKKEFMKSRYNIVK